MGHSLNSVVLSIGRWVSHLFGEKLSARWWWHHDSFPQTSSHQGKLHTDSCSGRPLRWGWENQRGMRSCGKQWVCFFCQLGTGRQRQHDLVSQDLQREQDPILRIFVAPGQNVMLVQTKPIIYKFHNFLENSWRKYSFFAWTEAPLRLWFGATTSKILKV